MDDVSIAPGDEDDHMSLASGAQTQDRIRVVVRARPLSDHEAQRAEANAVSIAGERYRHYHIMHVR